MSNNPSPLATQSLCDGLEGEYSLGLHVGAIFVILVASALGTILPLLSKFIPFLRRNPFFFVVCKTAATGVLLSVACIHLINDASESFREPCVSPFFSESYEAFSFLFALIAALAMHCIDLQLAETAERWMRRRDARSQAGDSGSPTEKSTCPMKESPPDHPLSAALKDADHLIEVPNCCALDAGPSEVHVTPPSAPDAPTSPTGLPRCGGHSHEIIVQDDLGHLRRVISAACMEFGVTLHSLFVGLAIGLTTDSSMKPLLIALVFHQAFEGMSMGSRLVDANFSIGLEFGLAMVFSFSAPIGMAAATIAASVNPSGMAGGGFVLMMAILDSICGGILLYLAFNLLFVDFAAEMKLYCKEGQPNQTRRKIAMFVALWTGMLMMAAVGKWL